MFENLPAEEISKIARDIATNLIFTSDYARPDMLPSIFMPIALGAVADMTEEYVNQIGMVYEYYDKAGPMSVNGYPIFMSCRFVNKHDTKIIWEKVNKLKELMKAV